MNGDFVTLEQACAYLGVSSAQMYQYTHRKALPFYKPLGRRIYFKRSELDDFIGSGRIAPQSEIEEQARQITRKPAAV